MSQVMIQSWEMKCLQKHSRGETVWRHMTIDQLTVKEVLANIRKRKTQTEITLMNIADSAMQSWFCHFSNIKVC